MCMTRRPEVEKFADLMEEVLRANDWKGGWANDSIQWFFLKLIEEVAEIGLLIREPSLYKKPVWENLIKNEAADVANVAMMIADKTGEL